MAGIAAVLAGGLAGTFVAGGVDLQAAIANNPPSATNLNVFKWGTSTIISLPQTQRGIPQSCLRRGPGI
jgi:hypothetical protein